MTETNGQECLCPPVGHCWDCPVPREQGRQAKLDATTREHLDDRYLDMTCMRCEGKPIVAGTGHCETCITGRVSSSGEVRFCPRCGKQPGHYRGDGRWECLPDLPGYWHQGRPLVGDDTEPHPLDADGVQP